MFYGHIFVIYHSNNKACNLFFIAVSSLLWLSWSGTCTMITFSIKVNKIFPVIIILFKMNQIIFSQNLNLIEHILSEWPNEWYRLRFLEKKKPTFLLEFWLDQISVILFFQLPQRDGEHKMLKEKQHSTRKSNLYRQIGSYIRQYKTCRNIFNECAKFCLFSNGVQ